MPENPNFIRIILAHWRNGTTEGDEKQLYRKMARTGAASAPSSFSGRQTSS